MGKQVLYGDSAKRSIKDGIDSVANAVKSTLGPNGRCVIIDTGYDEPGITKDGVTVARSIDFSDKVKNAGARLVRSVASKAAEEAGDGTTSATVLAQAMIEEGSKRVVTGVNPIAIRKGINIAVDMAVKFYKENSTPVKDNNTLVQVATISANNDPEVGKLIAEAIESVGKEGVVTVENSKSTESHIESVQGMRIDKGFISNYFITDTTKNICELDNPCILITDQKISTVKSIQKILEYVAPSQKSLFIVSDGIEGEALTMLILNKMRGTLRVGAAKCPQFGDKRKAILMDLAAVTGATFVSSELGMELSKMGQEVLGGAEKVSCTAKHTTFIKGAGDESRIQEIIESLRHDVETAETERKRKDIQDRIASIQGGIAVLYVGATSETELSEKKDRVDDALCATRAANEEGVLPGGGAAYLRASKFLETQTPDLTEDEKIGYQIVIHALRAPMTQILDNTYGEGEGKVIVSKVESFDNINEGFDANTEQYVDLMLNGIIDPTKVCRVATQQAASIASMYLTTDCIIVDEVEPKKETL